MIPENDTQTHADAIDVAESTGIEDTGDTALAAAQQEIAALNDKYLRAIAEMQNLQRRAQRDVEDAMKYSVASAAKPFLTVADNLARALSMAPNDLPEAAQKILEGVRATQRELHSALEKMGVVAIAADIGMALNPHEHEVMFEVTTDQQDNGTVVQVLEAGYKIHDRLLRPARVSVAKNSGAQTEKTMDLSA